MASGAASPWRAAGWVLALVATAASLAPEPARAGGTTAATGAPPPVNADAPLPPPLQGLALRTTDDTPFGLPTGEPVVLNLWATWCTPCIKEIPELNALHAAGQDRPAGRRWQVVGLNMDLGDAGELTDFVAAHGIRFPVAFDPADRAGAELDVSGLPTTLILGPEGAVRERVVGPEEWASEAWRKRLRALAEQP